jgi:hypothetical protein
MRAAASCLILAALACSNPISASDSVAAGTWGGDHAALEVIAGGGRIEYDCAHGEVGEPLRLDRDGGFDVTGTHTPGHGGPIREDEKLVSHPARYVGRVDGRRMTLTVTMTDTSETLGTFALTYGVPGRLMKCL